MYKKIAVEEGLSNVTQALNAAGYQTTTLDAQEQYNVQAIVVKGDSGDFIAAESNMKVPIINASGRTANEVVDVIRERLT